MVQVFDGAIQHDQFTGEQAAMMREAYLEAAAVLELSDPEARRHLAILVQSLAHLERFPGVAALTSLAVGWYISGQPVDAGIGGRSDG